MKSYKVLNKQDYELGNYKIVPIRFEDRFLILKWRNEQIFHLRQNKELTIEAQEEYFRNVIDKLFIQECPNQILFSFLENNILIGYGGLVHINWIDKNAEISFLMDTELQKQFFSKNWKLFLSMLEKVAFTDLQLHKIYTYAFDLRPNLYTTLEESGYFKEAVLDQHCLFDGNYIDVIIHSKINS